MKEEYFPYLLDGRHDAENSTLLAHFGRAIRDDRLDSHLLGFIHVIGQEVRAG